MFHMEITCCVQERFLSDMLTYSNLNLELSGKAENNSSNESESSISENPCHTKEVIEDLCSTHCQASTSTKKRKLKLKKASSKDASDDDFSCENSDFQSNSEPELLQSTDTDSDDEPSTTSEPKKFQSLGISLNKSEHVWKSFKSLHFRALGLGAPYLFTRNVTGSLNMIQRFKLERKLDYHTGCVNTLNFNETGDTLASGSDDLNIVIWDWARGKKKFHYESGHTGNVFQVICISFVPLSKTKVSFSFKTPSDSFFNCIGYMFY